MEAEPFTFSVIDLKQYVYCPRVSYYQTILPSIRPLTYKMEAGALAHIQAEGREKRRSLQTYGLQTGDRAFNVRLRSPELHLSGIIDMLIETPTELIPVDYKQTKKVESNIKLQLMAYGRLLQTVYPVAKPVTRGFIYLIPSRQAVEVRFTKPLQNKLTHALDELVQIVQQQKIPAPTKQHGRCLDCEFRRFCNDTL